MQPDASEMQRNGRSNLRETGGSSRHPLKCDVGGTWTVAKGARRD
jgi:hypothetical protein